MIGKLFSFGGRSGRLEYLGVGGIQILMVGLGFAILMGAKPMGLAAFALIVPLVVVFMWIGLAATVRRIRDMGWPMIPTLIGMMLISLFGVLLLVWPGKPADFDATVFSDDDPSPGKKRAKGEAETPAWMQNALAQVSAAKAAGRVEPTPAAPAPRMTAAMAAASGPRTEFGLRRWGQ